MKTKSSGKENAIHLSFDKSKKHKNIFTHLRPESNLTITKNINFKMNLDDSCRFLVELSNACISPSS